MNTRKKKSPRRPRADASVPVTVIEQIGAYGTLMPNLLKLSRRRLALLALCLARTRWKGREELDRALRESEDIELDLEIADLRRSHDRLNEVCKAALDCFDLAAYDKAHREREVLWERENKAWERKHELWTKRDT